MKMTWNFLFLFLFLFSACSHDPRLFTADHLEKIQVGEEKEFALLKLGPDFTPLVCEDKYGDKFEVMEYREKPFIFAATRVYRVYFVNNKLLGYERSRGGEVTPYEHWVDPQPSFNFPGTRVRAVTLTQFLDE